MKQIRGKWDSWKKSIKKEYSQKKNNLRITGGGPFEEVKLDNVGERILSIIGISASGDSLDFDCDADRIRSKIIQSENYEEEENKNQEVPIQAEAITLDWVSWNPTLLKQPVHPALSKNIPAAESKNEENKKPYKREKNRPKIKKILRKKISLLEQIQRKKLELLNLQIKITKREFFEKAKADEKHKLEMKLLNAQINKIVNN